MLAQGKLISHKQVMNPKDVEALLAAISRLPDWIRKDLAAKDSIVRARAEEELTAMLVGALKRKA